MEQEIRKKNSSHQRLENEGGGGGNYFQVAFFGDSNGDRVAR